jgi:hypothetical protein
VLSKLLLPQSLLVLKLYRADWKGTHPGDAGGCGSRAISFKSDLAKTGLLFSVVSLNGIL